LTTHISFLRVQARKCNQLFTCWAKSERGGAQGRSNGVGGGVHLGDFEHTQCW